MLSGAVTSSPGSPLIASVQPTSWGTVRQSMVFLVMRVCFLGLPIAGEWRSGWWRGAVGQGRAS